MKEISANLTEKSYMFAIPAYEGKIQAETALSCLAVAGTLSKINAEHCFNIVRGGALIDAVRNEIATRFLMETKCDMLICIDADIEFSWQDAMERLLVLGSHYPILAGAYPCRVDPPKFIINAVEELPATLNEHGLVAVKGMGMGFVSIQRSALEQMIPFVSKYYDKVAEREVYQFWKTGTVNEKNEYVGEDVYFFKKALEAGITPMLDPGISLKHHGTKVYDYKLMDCIDQLIGGKNGIQNS